MKILQCQALLAATLADAQCSAPGETPYARAGRSIVRMASAYESDGRTFMAAGDPVNALAAALYGLGWLHCGIASGLLVIPKKTPACPFGGVFDPLPPARQAKLDEKTGRYAGLLDTAIASVAPAPDPGTPGYAFAEQVRFIAGVYLFHGRAQASAARREEALASFSYGHGWLDAGVETGLFSIRANRQIFTVD